MRKLNQRKWNGYSCLCSLPTSRTLSAGGRRGEGRKEVGTWAQKQRPVTSRVSLGKSRDLFLALFPHVTESAEEHFKARRVGLSKTSPSLQAVVMGLAVPA